MLVIGSYQSVPVIDKTTNIILHRYHICPTLRVNGKEKVVGGCILSHQYHTLHLIADFQEAGIDRIGKR